MTASIQPIPRKVFLIGATGGFGKRVIAKLTADGHAVTGLYHSPDDAGTVRDAGAQPVQGDIAADSADDFADRIACHDAVIFCAGAGAGVSGDQVDAIDGAGPGKITAGIAVAYNEIPRDDVAGFLAAAVFTPGLNRVAIEITGGDTPLEQAVSGLEPRPAS